MPEYIITNSKGKEKRYSFPTADAAASYLDYARQNNLKVDQVYFDTDNSEQRFPVTKIELDDKGVVHTEVDGDIDRYLADRNTFADAGYGFGQKPMSEAYREAYSKGAEPTFEITEGNGARIIEEHNPTRVVPREEYDPARLQRTVQSVQGLGDRMGGVLSDRGISPIDATQPMSKIAGRTSSPIVDKATEYASSEIGGERLSAEDAARMEESPEYRDVYWNIRRKYGMTPEEYATLSVDNINERIEEALDIAEGLREEAIADQSNWYVDIHGNRLNAKDDQIKATIRAIKRAQRDLNDSRTKYGEKDGWHLGKRFWDGGELIAKLTPIYNMISSLESAGVTMGQAMAAGKMIEDPERLTPEQKLLLSLTSIQQSVAQYQQDMGGKHWASGVGEVLQEMPEFMMGMPLAKLATKAVTKGATKGLAKLAGKAIAETAEEATETAAETIARRALDKATGWAKVKQLAGDGIGTWGKSFGEAAIGAPTQTLFYKSLAEENLGQYQVRPDGSTIQQVTPAWGRVYRAWLGTALELHSEDMGMWIGKGLNALGRRMANVGFVRGLMRVPAARSPLMEVVRKELKVADPLSEALGEVYGDAIQPLFTGDLDWSQTLADPDYWLTTVVSSAGVSVAMELPSIMQFKRDADRVNKYGHLMDLSLAVMGEDLRGQLVAAVSHNSIEAQTKALANIDWKNVSRQDMAAAMDYVNAYVGRELYYNSYREAERQKVLQKQMNDLLALSYRSESGYENTMSIIKATAKPSSNLPLGREYYIVEGDYTQYANLIPVKFIENGHQEISTVFADQLNIGEPIDIADELAKQYDLMFGEELAREGVVSISQRIAQMRAEGVNEETIREVVSEDPAYHEYKEGDVVTDNQTGEPVTITEQTSTGEYIATKSSGERIAISYDQIADSGAYAEQAIERERTSGGVKEGDVVSFLDRDGEMVEGAVQQILSDGRIYVSVQTGENNGVPTYATQEITPNQIIPAEAQPAQLTPTEQVAEEVAADAAAEVQATEQTAPAEAPIEPQPASTADPRAIPTLEDGSIDYDAIEDPQQFINLYGKDMTTEELIADVTSFRDDARQNAERLNTEAANVKTPNEKKALRDQAKIEANRANKYQAVLDLLIPAAPVAEQTEVAPEIAPAAEEVVEPTTEEQAAEQPKAGKSKQKADNGVKEWYENLRLSGEFDQNNSPFVLNPESNIDFGQIQSYHNLPPAPIRLAMGDVENGYIHINRRHGKEIQKAGFSSIEEFVQYVANNITRIQEGESYPNEMGGSNDTYLVQAQDGHNNTLFLQLSRDGEYWNVNSAGVFKKSYGNSKKNIWSASEVQSGNSAVAIDGSQSKPNADEGSTSNGTPSNISESKGTTTEPITQEVEQENLQPTPENIAENQAEPRKISLEQYLGELGLSQPLSDYMLDKQKLPNLRTEKARKKFEQDAAVSAKEYSQRRESARAEYFNLVENGKIIPLSDIDRLLVAARGHEDLESTQAARRSLEKRGIDWLTGDTIKIIESSQLENEVVEPTSRGIVDMDTLQLTMSDEEFNSLLESGDAERMSAYLNELDDSLAINDQSPFKGQQELREEFKRLKDQYGGEDNIPADVMEDINARYTPYAELSRKVYDRKYALEDKLRTLDVQQQQVQKEQKKEMDAEHKATAFNGFLANKTALGASSAEKALSKKVKIEDKNYTIAEYVEQAVQSGKIELRTSEVPKYKGVSRRKWNQMDTAQQQAEQERIKNGGTTTEYYINDYNLGKVAYDYAQYLQAKATEQTPETASESQTQSAVEPEWLQKVPTDGRNFMVYTKVAGENSYSATDLKTGQAVGLVYASLVKRDRLQSLVEELPKVLLEGAHFQIRDTKGKIYYSSEPIETTKGKKKATTKMTTLKTVSGAEVKVPINLYKYVSTDKTRAYTGVYFDPEGFVVATDGHNMIAVKHDVAEADAEKFISKAGDVASTIFNWRIANPKPNTEKPMNVDFEDVEKQIGGKAGDKFVVFEIDGQEVGFPPKAIHVLADFQRAFGGQAFVGDMTAGKAIVIRSGDNYAIALQTTKYADLSQAIHIPSGIEQTAEQVEQPAAVSEQAQQPTEPTKQEPKPKRTADRKIEDYGEKIAGARKDILRNMSKNFDNATIESLIALPFAKAFVKPDLKKLVEAGVLRPDDAKYAEAIMWVYINKNKPKARKTDVWAAKRGRETRITAWAKKTFDGITRLRDFIEADEATRDELIAQYGQLGEQIKANEDIDRVRLNRLNGGALVFGDLYSPNPIEVVVAALDKLNYQAGDKITFDAPIVKAEYLGRYFNFENQDGEKVYAFSRANSIEEAIDTLVLQAKIRRGDTDIQYPTDMFSITREDPIREPSGMFTVFHINKRGTLIPETVEGREAAEKKVADYQSQGLSADLREEKKVVGYATHRIRFKNRLTDVETIFDEKFGSEGEARQALEERYDEFNDLANDYVASLSKQKREQPVPFEVTTSWNSETKAVKYVVKNTETGDVMSPQLDTRKEAEEYYKNHIEEWKAKWQEMKDARKKFVFFDDNVTPREGKDYRNGRDVTAEDLATTFGFRGIQFGNWTNDADRQAALNQAYDAFMDLADILGVSPKALSLAGELGIAFGARGGGSALAHYEPDEIVINLTKTKGAGSLAHEWWHALDNYFSRQGNIPMGFVTSNPTEAKMREEMRAAWQGVVKAVKGTEYAKRSMAQGDYWGRMLEMTARLFGEWTVYELAKTGRTNHFLSRGITPGRFDMWRRINYAAYKWSLPEDQTPMSFEEFALLPRSIKGMPFPTKEETEQMGEAVRNLFDVVQEKVDEQGNVVLFQRGDFPEMPNTEANRRAYNLVREKLQNAGIKVHEVSEEMANAMASLIGVEFATKRKSATETVLPEDESSFKGTAISTADGAKILKNLDNLANKYQELSNRPWTFIGDVANALGISMPNKASKYGIFEAMNGNEITIRLSDHNATVSNLDGVGENNAISIVISRKPNNGITNDGNAHIVEYYYPASKIQKADGKPLVDIITSIKQALYSGEYEDITGLAEREEVNLSNAEYQIVYHGSGAKFDRFDHSFMGTGEGAQAYGWGTYVTQIKGIGESYAEAMGGKPIKSKINSLALSISNKKEFIKVRKSDIRKNENYDKYAKGIRKNQISLEKELKVAREEENEKDIRFYEGLLETTQWQLDPKNHKNLIDSFWEDINDAQAEVDDMQAQIKQLKKELAAVPKFLYSVDIIDNLTPDTYISWEGIVDDEVIDRMQEKLTEEYGEDVALTANLKYGQSGHHFYQKLERALDSDRAASEFLHRNGFVGIEYPAQYQSGGRADNAKNYVIFNENDLKIIDRVELFQDSQGKIYGWAVGGEIYLTPDGLNANTAIHEYSHLWVEALRKKAPRKWSNIKEQLKATLFWQQVLDDPNYANIRENEDAVASEVLARLTGKNGAERLASEAQRIIDAGNGSLSARIEATALVQRVKRLLRDLWAWVARNIFGVTNEATISQLSDMVVDDLLNETPLTDAENSPFEAMFIGELGANVLDIEQKVSYRMANMDVAMQMEQAGKSPFDIKIATGWERGADGEWRYEISDAEAHLNIEAMAELNQRLDSGVRQRNADKLRQFEQNNPSLAKKRQEMIEKYSINSSAVEALDEVFELTPVVAEFKLRDLFDYNEAYEAYPQLMNTRVRVIDGMRSLGAHWGDNIDISLEVAQIPARMRATLLHEIQHSIQSIEGFAAGGNKEVAQELMREMEQEVLIFDFAGLVRGELQENPDLTDRQVTQKVISELKERTGLTREELESAKRIPSSKQRVEALAAARNPELYEYYWGVFQIFNAALDDEGNIDSMKAYRNLMGEVEARNTTSRRNMTAEQRRSSLGSATEDVNRGVQIYRSRQGDDFENLSEESKYSSRVEALSAVAHDVAAKLNAPIRVITDMDDVPRARQSWKGWWQRGESGEQIVVVVPNNIDAADIERTILHEAVAHYGLRKLLGESQFNLLLDTVLKSMTEEEVQQRMRKYGTNDPMVVADEYIAEVAEGNVTPSMFERVVSAVRAFLRDVLGLSVQMTDNDIRYLLWQSKNALEGKSAFGRAMVMAQGKPLADMVAEEYGYARAYTAEEQQIIDDAQRNGTYLKAPNGKPTNLTPKQWVQARTMAFKRWFGDWILPIMETPIHKSKGTFANLAEAEKWAKENLQGKKEKNRYTGEEISIGKNSIKEMLDPKFSKAINEQVHISALQSVLDFIKTGVPAEIHPDTHGRDFNVMRLYNAIEIEGKVYRVKSTVRKVKEGDKYYTYEIQEMELLEDTHNALGLPNANDRGRLNSNNSITAAKLLKGVKKTNSNEDILSHSQILDANGEPMVVWHGGTFAINEFTPKWAMHFGTKEAALQRILDQNWGYGNWEIIRNDDDTFGWKYTDPDAGEYEDEDYSRQSDKSFATPIEALEDATESMFDYVAHPYYLNIRNVERVDDMQDDDGWDNAIDEAKRSGVDGLVYRNDFEDEGNDSYIAFRSEQIKSAEINSGEFDPTDPDIRARRKDFLDAEGNTTKATPMKQAKEVKPEREFRANNLFGRFFETFWRYTGASQVVAGKTIDGLVIKAGEKELARRIKKGEELLRKREAPFVSAFIKKKIGKGDAMAAFQKLSKADKLQLSKVITGFNPVVDYMSAENRSESQGEYALKKYFDGFIAPLNESRRRMREVMGISDQELETYVSGESSLERHNSGTDALSTDETKAWSLKKVEGIVTRFRSRLRNNMELQLKQQGANALSEAEKELLGEDLIKKLTEEGYDSLSAGEQMAACEAPVEVLWERIRALNNEHLNILLRAGRYSHDDIERIKSHDWRYYVPMFKQDLNVEGLIDPAAVYDVDVFYGTPSAPSLKPALGRDTKSQDVFRSMYQLGQRCVVFEVRNRVARSLYDFTIWANDHLGVDETRKYWHDKMVYQTKTASGKWVDEDTMPTREELDQMHKTQREINILQRRRKDITRQIDRLSREVEATLSESAADVIDDALRGLVSQRDELIQKIAELEKNRKWRAKKSNFDFEDPTSAQAIERERTVRVWIDGREHRMVFADPDIARAVNGNKNGIVKAVEALGRLVGPFTRFRAQMNTQYSPDFIVSNTLRDYQHALLAMALAEQGDITLSFAGNYFRHLGDVFRSRGINYNPLSEAELKGHVPYYSYERMRSAYIAAKIAGEQITEEEFDRAYRDEVALNRIYLEEVYGKARVRDTFIDAFQRYGGATGFIHQLNSKQIEKQLREAMLLKEDVLARRYVDPTTPFRLIRDVISRVSESMEDITRFATFMAHLDHGASVERAAQEAKEVTTNFNRRGELATGLGSLYMFFNASVQGSAQVMRLIKQHPRRAAAVLPLYALLGFMQRITRGMLWKIGAATGIKALFFDDDDEERPRTEEQLEKEKAIRDYMYSDNLIIVLDRTLDAADTALDGIYLRIPQPNGFRAAYKVGVELAEVAMGGQRWDELPESLISTLAGEFVYGFGDTGELTSDMWRMVIPSAVQPISDLLLNKDFVNRTIYNEREYNPIAPAYTVAKSNTPSLYIDASRILNSIGGTDTRSADYNKRYEKRAIGLDVPPEAIKYLVGEMFGGVGTFANRMWTTVEFMTDGEKGNLAKRDIPFVNRVIGEFEPENVWPKYKSLTDQIEAAWLESSGFRAEQGIDMRKSEWKDPDVTYPYLIEHYKDNPYAVEMLRKRWLLDPYFKEIEDYTKSLKRLGEGASSSDRVSESREMSSEAEIQQASRTLTEKFILELSKHVDWRAATNEEVIEQVEQITGEIKGKNQ